jgi:hypothetical protein
MTRRIIFGRRGGAYGLWVSKAGVDVESATGTNLLFDMSQRMGMVLEEGSAVVPSGGGTRSISFAREYPSIPLVFCGQLTNYPSNATVRVNASRTGFILSTILDPSTGTYMAAGDTVRWFAVMQTEA